MNLPPAQTPAYHRDPFQRELGAWVDAAGTDERWGPYLILSDTICHPHGGGQKGDRATLRLTPAEASAGKCVEQLPVVDTRRDGERILHILPPEVDIAGLDEALTGEREVTLALDWDFRLRQMRLHSAAHLLHCFVARTVGDDLPDPDVSDLQPGFGLNRYERPEVLTPAQMSQVTEALNAFIAEDHPIRTTADEARPGFRYWHCEEWRIPCGGTHLAATGQIGTVDVTLSLKRGRTSMTFRLDPP
jgi:alanyl-tRNA synthetase/misacylated tRNA(Ala) deacylase